MANSYNVIVVTAFNSNQNSSQLFANTGMNGNNNALISSIGRFQASLPLNSYLQQWGYIYFPQNTKTTYPTQPGKTSYPRFP